MLVAVLSESGRDFQKQDMCTATAVSSEQVKKRKAGMELEGGSYKRKEVEKGERDGVTTEMKQRGRDGVRHEAART